MAGWGEQWDKAAHTTRAPVREIPRAIVRERTKLRVGQWIVGITRVAPFAF
jgi:hypothetical protein